MPAVIEVRAHSNLATEAVNVWHWRIPNSTPVTEVNGITTALDTFYTALATHLQTSIWTIDGLVRTVDQAPNQYIQGTTQTATMTGTTGTNLSSSICLNKKSALVGGSRRGRVFLGPITGSAYNNDGRSISTAATAAVLSAAATLFSTATNGVEFGVWSRKFQTFTPTPNASVDPIVATQRRRLT